MFEIITIIGFVGSLVLLIAMPGQVNHVRKLLISLVMAGWFAYLSWIFSTTNPEAVRFWQGVGKWVRIGGRHELAIYFTAVWGVYTAWVTVKYIILLNTLWRTVRKIVKRILSKDKKPSERTLEEAFGGKENQSKQFGAGEVF